MKIKVIHAHGTHSKLSIKLSLHMWKVEKSQEISIITQERDQELFRKEAKKGFKILLIN